MPIKKNITCLKNNIKIIPFPKDLCQPLPEITGSVDYRNYEEIIKHIDFILLNTGIEEMFIKYYLQEYNNQTADADKKAEPMGAFRQMKMQITAKQALRCTIARKLLQLALREFTCRLADSALLQWFCQLDTF